MILSGGKWIDHPRSYSFSLENRSVDRHVENASWLENTAHSRECCTIAHVIKHFFEKHAAVLFISYVMCSAL